jgi:hypothetical protein
MTGDPDEALALWQYHDVDMEYRKLRKLREELTRRLASRRLGVELPAAIRIVDKDARLWELNVRATLTPMGIDQDALQELTNKENEEDGQI